MDEEKVIKTGLDASYTDGSVQDNSGPDEDLETEYTDGSVEDTQEDASGDLEPERYVGVTSLRRFGIMLFLLGVLSTVLLLFVYFQLLGQGMLLSQRKADYYTALDNEFGKYYDMERKIAKESYYKADPSSLDGEISRSVLATVPDQYAEYFTAEEYNAFERKYTDSYTGIGISINTSDDGNVVINRVLAGGPAESAGVMAGDIILKVDGASVKSLSDASDKISGEAGSKVVLTVSRSGNTKEFELERVTVEDSSVSSKVLDAEKGVGLIQIATFRKGTADALKKNIDELKQKDCDKFIIDLRGNPGGITDEGIDAADLLLPSCKIVTVKDHSGKSKTYRSKASHENIRFVLLVDAKTASAAEIFTAAVQDNGAATVIGTKTYGKGVIQSVYRLKDDSVMKITTAEYFSPKGHTINGNGITPDQNVSGTEEAVQAGVDLLTAE